jgi:replicative DNA helicase
MNANPEVALIATLISSPEATEQVSGIVSERDFTDERMAETYAVIHALMSAGSGVDIVTVSDRLAKSGMKNAPEFLVTLSASAELQSHAPTLARIVREKSIVRQVGSMALRLQSQAKSPDADPFKLLSWAQEQLETIGTFGESRHIERLGDVVRDTMTVIGRIVAGELNLAGTPTYFTDLDRIIGGFEDSDLITIAGRPGVGKTAFALSIANNMAAHEIPVGFFSLEMNKRKMGFRHLAMRSGVSVLDMKRGHVADKMPELVRAAAELHPLPIYLDDTPSMTALQVRSKVRQMKAKHGIRVAFVDRLDIMDGETTENRVQELTRLTKGLKSIAMEFNIPVVMLCQLNRSVEKRDVKIPTLADLRDSGSIEQDSQVVLFPYRAEYYAKPGEKVNLISIDGQDASGLAEIFVGKNTDGASHEVAVLAFDRVRMRFGNWSGTAHNLPEGV